MNGFPEKKKLLPVLDVNRHISIVPENKKRCPKCKEIKNRTEFHKSKQLKDGLYSYCKECNKKKRADWYIDNGEIAKQKCRIYRIENNEEVTRRQRELYHLNREDRLLVANKFWDKNKEELNRKRRERHNNDLERRESNNLKSKEWGKNNKEQVKHRRKEFYEKNKDRIRKYARDKSRNLDRNQRDVVNTRMRAWRNKNKDVQNEKLRIRRNGNITKKISNNISTAIRDSLHGMKAGRRWETLVGYTVEQVRVHLEVLFWDDMNWDDFLKGEIHIDHIRPIDSFNFTSTDDLDFKLCWALSNLQPLWATDNCRKGSKLNYVVKKRRIK